MKERRHDYPKIMQHIEKNGDDLISLREYFDLKLKAQEDKVDLIIDGQKLALNLASSSMEKRLESMNEFRAQLTMQATTFLTKEAYDTKHQMLQNQVDELRLSRATIEGKADQNYVNKVMLISVLGLLITFAGLGLAWIKINTVEAVSYGYSDYTKYKTSTEGSIASLEAKIDKHATLSGDNK